MGYSAEHSTRAVPCNFLRMCQEWCVVLGKCEMRGKREVEGVWEEEEGEEEGQEEEVWER